MAILKLLFCLSFVHMTFGKGSAVKTECTQEVMRVTIPMDGDRKLAYLDLLKGYEPCQPTVEGNVATFVLDLQDYYKCGVTRLIQSLTGKRTYYNKVVIESSNGDRESVVVKCTPNKARLARQTQPFPLDLIEPDNLTITRNEVGHAPEPMLFAVVKKNGVPVPRNDSVSPGTHLTMEIFLDNTSAPVYGLFVSYMYATNTDNQQETIILNGCSLDASLFNNFQTQDGDLLVAKFRAFKFPDTTYVMFIGTVTVCLDKCPGVQCSNGVTGYGRRKRSVPSGADRNRVYEVSLTTFLKVDWKDGETEAQDVAALIKNLKAANQMLLDDKDGTPATVAEQTQDHKLVLHSPGIKSNAAVLTYSCLLVLYSLLITLSH